MKKMLDHPVFLSILMIILGIILFLRPGMTLQVAARVVGIAFLIGGILSLANWYRTRTITNASYLSLVIGVVASLAGLIIMIAPGFVISLFPIIIGILILSDGIVNLMRARDLHSWGIPFWRHSSIMAAISIVLGILICANPFGTMGMLVRIIGLVFIYNGVVDLLVLNQISQHH